MDVKNLGQVFTPDSIAYKMISLRRNRGRCLEPSCGDGSISGKITNVVAIEYDKSVCPNYATNMDFFDYDISNKFESIIGNPPYVKYKDILSSTKKKLNSLMFNNRSNLYLFFIEKCIRHLTDGGELIFLVPRDFFKATSSMKLNEFIYQSGTITDIVDFGDGVIFKGFAPNCIIFRFEKNCFDRNVRYENASGEVSIKRFVCNNGQLLFQLNEYDVDFKDIFFVKVGGVSGADSIYINDEWGNMDFVCSDTRRTGKTRRMIYNTINEYILEHEKELRSRRIMNITDDNWWKWGRDFYKSIRPRIYVNSKTRTERPFFINKCVNYDGSVLAIFPKNVDVDINELCSMLNDVDWGDLGFICGGRYIFSQKSLENSKLPHCFHKYLKTEISLW